jgi:glutathione S-transferase
MPLRAWQEISPFPTPSPLQAKESGLAPAWGTSARYELINLLNYIASELHASYGPLFNPNTTEEGKTAQKERVATKLQYIAKALLPEGKKGKFLLSDDLDVASIYLYIVLSWSGYVGVDLTPYPTIQAFSAAVAAHEGVQKAHAEMNAASQ